MTSSIVNVGIDMGFFQERLRFEYDMFRRMRDGLPAKPDDVVFPQESGMTVMSQTLKSDEISGIDVTVRCTETVSALKYQ